MRHVLVRPHPKGIAAASVAIVATSLVAPCDSSDNSSSSASQGPGAEGGPGWTMQTYTAVDLNTDGENAAGSSTGDVVAATEPFLATLSA